MALPFSFGFGWSDAVVHEAWEVTWVGWHNAPLQSLQRYICLGQHIV